MDASLGGTLSDDPINTVAERMLKGEALKYVEGYIVFMPAWRDHYTDLQIRHK